MCNCRFGVIASTVSVGQLMDNDQLKKTLMEDTIIKKDCFMRNDPEALFLLAWCFDRNTFSERFKPYFEVKDQKDVIAISKAHKDGKDIEIDKVNYLDLIKDISKDPSKIYECGISFCD